MNIKSWVTRTASSVQDARDLKELVYLLELGAYSPLGHDGVVMAEVQWHRLLMMAGPDSAMRGAEGVHIVSFVLNTLLVPKMMQLDLVIL